MATNGREGSASRGAWAAATLLAGFSAAGFAVSGAGWLAFDVGGSVWAQAPTKKTVRRAAAPKFAPEETKNVFFENIFDGRVLNGDRPSNFAAKAGGGGGPAAGGAGASGGAAEAGPTGAWSKLLSAGSIEDEVKAIKLAVDKDVTTPTDFAGKGYKECRRHFSMLAVLFAIINEYDGDVRWKNDAASARDVFARTAANAKVGTSQVYNEAKLRKGELEELLGGGGLPNKQAADPKTVWVQVCDRSPLMQRLEQAMEPRLAPWTANPAEFKAKKEEILKEAEIVAMIGEVLAKEGMNDADADDYKMFCETLKKGGRDVADAVKLDNADAARLAVGVISKSCDDCHNVYR